MATARIETNLGVIEFELLDGMAPKTAENFTTLAKKGFYNGVIFHRVVPGFVIQGGDPDGTGRGGPGYSFDDEPVTGAEDPLLHLDNCLCTPHLGYVEADSYEMYFRAAFENVLAFVRGEPTHIINPEALKVAR